MNSRSSKYLIPFSIFILFMFVSFITILLIEEQTNYFSSLVYERIEDNNSEKDPEDNVVSYPEDNTKPYFSLDEIKELSVDGECYVAIDSKIYDIPIETISDVQDLEKFCGTEIENNTFDSLIENIEQYYVANLKPLNE